MSTYKIENLFYVGARLEMRALGKTTFRNIFCCTTLSALACSRISAGNASSTMRHCTEVPIGMIAKVLQQQQHLTQLHEERSIYNSMVRDANLTVAVVLALKLLSITNHVVMTLERITALTLLSSALHCSLAKVPCICGIFGG